MSDLKTNYIGLELKNPVIVGASNMVEKIENVQELEEAGAAAIVFKSLFEEQLHLENLEMGQVQDEASERHAEMIDPFPHMEDAGPKEHLMQLKKVKEAVNIPVIGSLNAVYEESWEDLARQIADTGVDALEVNFYAVPKKFEVDSTLIEKKQINTLERLKKAIDIPIGVKLSPFYANPLNLIKNLDNAGADGVVIFNRLFQPDINIDTEEHEVAFDLSGADNYKLALRFAGLLYGEIKGSICANNGIYSAEEVIKTLLAGADCVQVVSTIYKNKPAVLKKILSDLDQWMAKKKYSKIDDFKGKLSNQTLNDPFIYKRAQYVEMLMRQSKDVLRSHPLR